MWFAVTGGPVTSLNRLIKSLLQKGHDVTVIRRKAENFAGLVKLGATRPLAICATCSS
jgi:hypothetical protein